MGVGFFEVMSRVELLLFRLSSKKAMSDERQWATTHRFFIRIQDSKFQIQEILITHHSLLITSFLLNVKGNNSNTYSLLITHHFSNHLASKPLNPRATELAE